MVKIGFLGPKGTFSQEAMLAYTKGSNDFVGVDYNTMVELIMAVENDEIDEAVVPIENSLEGAVSTTMDMLAWDVDLKIKAEVVIEIKQNLMAKKGTDIKDIKYILSHPQPVGQCRKFLNSVFPHAVVKYVYSTAQAAKEVAQGDGNMASIGSLAAAKEYGLEVLKESIQDNDKNFTRFVVISKKKQKKPKRTKLP